MIDASQIKLHPHAAKTKGGLTARYIWPWMRLVCRSELLLHLVPLMIAQKLMLYIECMTVTIL
jgi:hypothetical protein